MNILYLASKYAVALVTAAAVAAEAISDDSVGLPAATVAVDVGVTAAKAGYKVATGECSTREAFEAVADRAMVGVMVLTEKACEEAGAWLGAAVANALAAVFAPSSVAIAEKAGAAVGRVAGKVAGKVVAPLVNEGLKQLAPIARAVVSTAKKAIDFVGDMARNATRSFVSLFS